MRKLVTTDITNSVGFPVKAGTLNHIQLAYQEALTALANSIIGRLPDSSNCYILFGCKNTGSGTSYVISAGAIYYNGEVYLVDAVSFTAASGQTAVLNFVTTNYTTNADPVTFTDGVAHNVHTIQKIAIASGVSGSGVCDYANTLTPLALVNDQQATLPSTYTVNFKQDKATFFAAASVDTNITFDFTNAVAGTVIRLKWTYGSGRALTITAPSGSTVIKDGGNLSAVASANNLLYCIYLGKNESNNHEVSYTLKQF
jgi:hypothetical protein